MAYNQNPKLVSELNHLQQNNSIVLTLEEISKDNKAYLIDKRLLDLLLLQTDRGDLEMFKAQLKVQIDEGSSKADVIARVDEFLYVDKVINHPNLKEELEVEYKH